MRGKKESFFLRLEYDPVFIKVSDSWRCVMIKQQEA